MILRAAPPVRRRLVRSVRRSPTPTRKLAFDEALNRVVGRVVDETTGATIHEIPPEQLKALYTKMRDQLGPLIDGTA